MCVKYVIITHVITREDGVFMDNDLANLKVRAVELRQSGMQVKAVADELGKSVRTVARYLKEAGVSCPADRTDILDSDVLAAWERGLTIAEIAAEFGASHDTITKRLAAHGVSCGRAEGILRHFEKSHDGMWPDVKADLDRGLAITVVAGMHHMRYENVRRLMLKHGYTPPPRVASMNVDIHAKAVELSSQLTGKSLSSAKRYLSGIDGYYAKYGSLPSIRVLANVMGVAYTSAAQAVSKYGLGCFVCDTASSGGVVMVMDELVRMGVAFETNNRTLLRDTDGRWAEIDIYIPDWRFGIEVNPTGTHSVDIPVHGALPRDYHQRKALMAEAAGIGLVHMYDDDFQDPRKFGAFTAQLEARAHDKIHVGARKCVVSSLDAAASNEFLARYHFQGAEKSARFRYGLFYDGVLAASLCIGKSRYTDDEYEIIRYCARPDYAVSGGFMKLLRYFISSTGARGRIVSYMDLDKRFSCSNVYERNGFRLEKTTRPDYAWYKKSGMPVLSRYETTKARLVGQGYDADMTEVEIMRSRGYFRVFGAGSKRYAYEIK